MRTVCYVFSGTGNTEKLCLRLGEELMKRGHSFEMCPIRGDVAPVSPREFDLVIVGYPVHAFNAPAPVLSFLKKLRDGGGKPAVLVRTSGEPLRMNDASGISPRRILSRRGYRVCGEYHYVMPYNIIFRHSDGMAARMWRAAELKLPHDAEEIVSGGGNKPKIGVPRRLVSFVLRVEHPGMHAIGRAFKATETCVGCGKCAVVCPVGNITMKDGKPSFGGSCAGCMACAFHCPRDAIRTGILNGWRVNGAYTFSGEPAADDEVCDYCKKSYLRYFHGAEGGSK